MDHNNINGRSIRVQLKSVYKMRLLYTSLYAFEMILVTFYHFDYHLEVVPEISDNTPLTFCVWAFCIASLVFKLIAHHYLYTTLTELQDILRACNMVTGNFGEKTGLTFYALYFGNLIFYYVWVPNIALLTNVWGGHCSYTVKTITKVLKIWSELGWPLPIQFLFFGIIWQLSRIKHEAIVTTQTGDEESIVE